MRNSLFAQTRLLLKAHASDRPYFFIQVRLDVYEMSDLRLTLGISRCQRRTGLGTARRQARCPKLPNPPRFTQPFRLVHIIFAVTPLPAYAVQEACTYSLSRRFYARSDFAVRYTAADELPHSPTPLDCIL